MSLHTRRERAERAILDAATAIPLPMHKLIMRHNAAVATIRTLWVSRRKWRAVAEQLADQVVELEESYAYLLNAFRATSDQAEALATDAWQETLAAEHRAESAKAGAEASPADARAVADALSEEADLHALRARVAELEDRIERRRARLVAAEADLLDVRGVLSPQGYPRCVPDSVDIRGSVVPAVEWLVSRVAELEEDNAHLLNAQHDAQLNGGAR